MSNRLICFKDLKIGDFFYHHHSLYWKRTTRTAEDEKMGGTIWIPYNCEVYIIGKNRFSLEWQMKIAIAKAAK
jgi:hypothetical protein